jgi:GT2 family glycosyltransferase
MVEENNVKRPLISVIIPYYESDPDKQRILRRCVNSLQGHDEIILVWNDKMGYAKSINRGLSIARGEYLVVMNDDLIWKEGSLLDLVDPMAVTSPQVNGIAQDFWGCCFCMPRWVYEQTGGLDERYRISYFDDDDFKFTLEDSHIEMNCVRKANVLHPEGGRTLHTFPDRDQFFEENKQKFLEKWGRLP